MPLHVALANLLSQDVDRETERRYYDQVLRKDLDLDTVRSCLAALLMAEVSYENFLENRDK